MTNRSSSSACTSTDADAVEPAPRSNTASSGWWANSPYPWLEVTSGGGPGRLAGEHLRQGRPRRGAERPLEPGDRGVGERDPPIEGHAVAGLQLEVDVVGGDSDAPETDDRMEGARPAIEDGAGPLRHPRARERVEARPAAGGGTPRRGGRATPWPR